MWPDAFPENVEVMSFPENHGFAEAGNKAVARCSGYKYVVLLNSDVAHVAWLGQGLCLYMEANRHGCLPAKILSLPRSGRFEYAGSMRRFPRR